MIASVEGRSAPSRGRARHRGRRPRLPGLRCPGRPRRAEPGAILKLHTYHLVREDQQALYGFRTAEELGFFNLLLTVTGVGPKVALAIVGSRPTADLQLAILQQDQAVLVSIPGIGKKLAERIIFELKEKVAAAGDRGAGPPASIGDASEGEVVAALQALGYSLGEARGRRRDLRSRPTRPVGAGLEERVKAALRTLLRD
jgi:holliday junction DNA helicase RuvA